MKTLYLTTKKQLETIREIEDTEEALSELENLKEDLEEKVVEMLCYNDPNILKLEIEIEKLQVELERKLEFENGEIGVSGLSNTGGIRIVIVDDGEGVLYQYFDMKECSDIFDSDIEYRENEHIEDGELHPCFKTKNGNVFFIDEFIRVDF